MTTPQCVLVVDDDPGIRHLLVTLLRRRGFQALSARNGYEALAAMRAGHVDAVIMDLMMPVMSGFDLLRERATDSRLLCIPIIVLTARNIRDVVADLADKKVFTLLAKPFDLPVLLTAVTDCLAAPHAPYLAA